MRKTASKDRQIDFMDLLDGVGVSVQLTNSRETGSWDSGFGRTNLVDGLRVYRPCEIAIRVAEGEGCITAGFTWRHVGDGQVQSTVRHFRPLRFFTAREITGWPSIDL